MQDNWINIIRNKIKDYEKPLSDDFWSEIEDDISKIVLKRKVTMIYGWRIGLITTAAVIIAALFLINTFQYDSKSEMSPTHPKDYVQSNNNPIFFENQNLKEESLTTIDNRDNKASVTSPCYSTTLSKSITTNKQLNNNYPVINKVKSENQNTITTSKKHRNDKTYRYEEYGNFKSAVDNIKQRNTIKLKKEDISDRFSINLYARNLSVHKESYTGYGRLLGKNQLNNDDNNTVAKSNHEVLFFNQNRDIKEEQVYSLPISIGLTASYALTSKLSIESGLIYTYLISKSRIGTESNFIESSYSQHMIGLPVLMRFSIYKIGDYDFYTSIGGSIERAFTTTDIGYKYFINYTLISEESTPNHNNYYLWSLKGGLGIRFNMNDHIGLFLEPGITYYIKNSQLAHSGYTKNPLKVHLTIGLNFRLR